MRRALSFLSSISVRLLAFNVLLVFLPAAGVLYLDTYERQLLLAQERAMVQQGRLLAAALARADRIDAEQAVGILYRLQQRHQARLRVLDGDGRLIVDSSSFGPRGAGGGADAEAATGAGLRRGWLYRIGALPFRVYRRLFGRPQTPLEPGQEYSGDRLMGSEVRAALAGRYGATTRLSGGQRSVTLYTAIPIQRRSEVIGVALVSQSTLAILQALDAVRLDILKVVLASITVAAILSLLVSTTIARPLRRLRDDARAIVDRRGRLKGGFRRVQGYDEIADLSRALEELTARLRSYVTFVEAFASDVSHEFKNPLAAVRSASEMLADGDDPEQRRRLVRIVEREVARMEHLLSGVGEMARIDAHADAEEQQPVDVVQLLRDLVQGYRQRHDGAASFDLTVCDGAAAGAAGPAGPAGAAFVSASPDRLAQVFENLLDNAVSFSPPPARIRIEVVFEPGHIAARITDEGPGIPAEHLQRIFNRFFSYRDEGAAGNGHLGLGLSIARAIVEAYGGSIRAENGAQGGATFEVRLPAAAG